MATKTAVRRGTMRNMDRELAPDYNRGTIENSVVLNSFQAQEVFRRTYELTNAALYSLGPILRAVVNEDEDVEKVVGLVKATLEKVQKEIADERARLELLLKNNEIFDTVKFTKPQTVIAEISSPHSATYLGLVAGIDSIVAQMTALWLHGIVSDKDYSNRLFQWQRRMRRVSLDLRNINRQAMRAAKRKRAEMIKAEQALAEKKAQEAAKEAETIEEKPEGKGKKKTEIPEVDQPQSLAV
ncbi:MAG: hypothetical protein M0O99_04945 [Desulfuromonas thiophila]|nr:hypothetical protein [Desulfuromonas thiophila]